MSFLEKILPAKRTEAEQFAQQFASAPARRPADLPVRDFEAALRHTPGAVIAEVKHRSPSHARFRQSAPPARLAAAYRRGGAAALSVVTDAEHFGTSLADVRAMREASGLPVLTKDFVIAASQIQAAWAAGADAVLLIARMLEQETLTDLLAEVHRLGLQSLVECHDEEDIARSVAAGARIVGINNRNLASLETDLTQTPRLVPLVPGECLKVSESGIQDRSQIEELARAGADAFLIGHALLLSPDPGGKLRELTGLEDPGKPRVKICGLTRPLDAAGAHQAGADILGMVLAPGPRQVSIDQLAAMRQVVPQARMCGVFLDHDQQFITEACDRADLDLIQLHGTESPTFCEEIHEKTGLPVIKALTLEDLLSGADERYSAVAYLLLDLPKGEQDEDLATIQARLRSEAVRLQNQGRRVLLAGGINAGNVGAAAEARPFAIDISRGVESAPGQKDLKKIARVLKEVRS